MPELADFTRTLKRPDLWAWIRAGLIGENAVVEGPWGARPMIYADYVASGRALAQVEDFIRDAVLPYYANTHTQASYCGAHTSLLREAARAEIARITGAGAGMSVIFTSAGSTSGLNRIVGLLDIAGTVRAGSRAVVLIGPYEHHSNILPWRESGAEVIEIAEGPGGGPDMALLEEALKRHEGADLLVGAFGAASNVTGVETDVDAVTRMLKAHGALAIWDYGCAAPYVEIDMRAGSDAQKDAVVFSPHKFIGGPGASGVTVIRDAIARIARPTLPGGGTVSFVSPWGHSYSASLTDREEGGTPNVPGDIRAGLVMLVKEALGHHALSKRQEELRQRARTVWARNPRIELLGPEDATKALPIFSFRVHDGQGGLVHHQLFTRMLSDFHGIQARGGCACAGSYGHRLLGLGRAESDATFAAIAAGEETEKPGWVRLNFSALLSDEKADRIISAVDALAAEAPGLSARYRADRAHARFSPIIGEEARQSA